MTDFFTKHFIDHYKQILFYIYSFFSLLLRVTLGHTEVLCPWDFISYQIPRVKKGAAKVMFLPTRLGISLIKHESDL